jgi:extracellular matrix regulatory protein B
VRLPLFIQIGDEHVIQSKDVVAIIDKELYSTSPIVEEMIMNQRANNKVIDKGYDSAKSIIITNDYIYFSSLTVHTLKRRAQLSSTLDKTEDFSISMDE